MDIGIDLAGGTPLAADPESGYVLAVDSAGGVASFSGEGTMVDQVPFRVPGMPMSTPAGLGVMTESGQVVDKSGAVLVSFDLEGVADVESGLDIFGESVAFTVQDDRGFSVVIGDVEGGKVETLVRSNSYIGQARWAPGGRQLALVGPDYSGVWLVDTSGSLLGEISVPEGDTSSGVVTSPEWASSTEVVVVDAAGALVRIDTRSQRVTGTRFFGDDPIPTLLVAAPSERRAGDRSADS